jgi:hypothetical protein
MHWTRIAAIGATLLAVSAPAFAAPDWHGAWYRKTGTFFHTLPDAPFEAEDPPMTDPRWRPPYTPEFAAIYEDNLKRIEAGRYPDPISLCGTPAGWPRMLVTPDAYEFVVRPEQTWILSENGPNVVRIYTDGRSHPPADEMWPTFTGHSVGHWEGDTLVFETIGMKGVGSVILGRQGVVMSDQLKVTTRIRSDIPNRLVVTMVLEDPKALTRPWPVRLTFERFPEGTNVWDYACAENNRNPVTTDGRTLTLGPNGQPIDIEPGE